MTDIPFFIIDAFTNAAFSGNPAAVCLLEQALPESDMQQIAKEFNQAETAFVIHNEKQSSIRWFSPKREAQLCGHATLAAAKALWSNGSITADAIQFESASGTLGAKKDGEQIVLDFPRVEHSMCMTPPGLAEAIGAAPFGACQAGPDLLVELGSADAVRDAQVNIGLVAQLPIERGLIICAEHDDADYDIICRFFAPRMGIAEDHVTGSAHCAIGPYFEKRFDKDSLRSFQASPRGGSVQLGFQDDRVLLGGEAHIVCSGQLHLAT